MYISPRPSKISSWGHKKKNSRGAPPPPAHPHNSSTNCNIKYKV